MNRLTQCASILMILVMAACATAQQTAQSTDDAAVVVPASFASGRPAVEAEVTGRTMLVAFDTGGQSAIIPRSLAAELNLATVGETLVGSPYGGEPIRANIVSLGSISIAGIQSSDATAVVLDDERFPANERRLIIGSGQFSNYVITLDFARSTLALSAVEPAIADSWLPLDERNFLRTDLVIGGHRIPVIIDSGNPRGMVLPIDQLEQIAPGRQRVQVGEIRTVDRTIPRYAADLDLAGTLSGLGIQLGRVEFAPVPVGNIGSAALTGMRLIIDMPRRRWRLDAVATQPIRISLPTA